MHVFGTFGAEAESADHAELCIQFLGGVGVDRVGASGFSYVHGNQIGLAAANDDNVGWGWERFEGIGSDGGRKTAEILLTDLGEADCQLMNYRQSDMKRLTPQKK